MRLPINWLKEHSQLKDGISAEQLAKDLVKVGLEEEEIHTSGITGPLVIGEVVSFEPEIQNNGKTINWCQVNVGENELRGIVCGAPNITNNQKVIVALPGVIFPDGFEIAARKTYGHVSNGMICSERELGLSQEHNGILDITNREEVQNGSVKIGDNALDYLGLGKETLEINITPDRGYCFSMRGVGREYSLSTGQNFIDKYNELKSRVPNANDKAFEVKLDDKFPIRDRQGCERFVTRIVSGIDPTLPSPKWLVDYLQDAGMRSISLIVDISNYVMLDLGQPIHHYDFDKVIEPIFVRRAKTGEKLVTLDDKERVLNEEDLLITDSNGERVLGLAGVMGGQSSEVSDTTTAVLVEAAFFDPVSIARTAKRHKLPSEASKRFERTIDYNIQCEAAQLCVDLLLKYGGKDAKDTERIGDINNTEAFESITFDYDKVEQVIGINVEKEKCVEILREIGCEVKSNENSITVTPPSWRADLNIAETYIEEIARVYGYDKIPSILPNRNIQNAKRLGLSKSQKSLRRISDSLALNGFSEVISYPFVGKDNFENMLIDKNDYRSNVVKLSNPLQDQKPFMRTEILQTLLDSAKLNISRSNTSFKIFEQGLVYYPPKSSLYSLSLDGGYKPSGKEFGEINKGVPLQPHHLAGIIVGNSNISNPYQKALSIDWKESLKVLEILSKSLFTDFTLVSEDKPLSQFHPYRVAGIKSVSKVIGTIGELHPQVCKNYNLPEHSVAFEINLSGLNIDLDNPIFDVQEISKFPPVKQDLSLLVPKLISILDVQNIIKNTKDVSIDKLEVIDIYNDEKLGDFQSVTFEIWFRSLDSTLTPEIEQDYRNKVLNLLKAKGIELRS